MTPEHKAAVCRASKTIDRKLGRRLAILCKSRGKDTRVAIREAIMRWIAEEELRDAWWKASKDAPQSSGNGV